MSRCTAPATRHHKSVGARVVCPEGGHGAARYAAEQRLPTAPQAHRAFWVDTNADGSELVGGEPCEDARFTFLNRRCLGLAMALSEDFGTDRVLVAYEDETEHERGPGLDPVSTYEYFSPIHVWGVDSDAKVWDYAGDRVDEDVLTEMEEIHPDSRVEFFSVAEALDKCAPYMLEQNHDFARTFVPVVREGHSLDYMNPSEG